MNRLRLKILLTVFISLLLLPAFSYHQPHTTATILGIVDGDTLEIELQGQKESVRLIGIDCPEGRERGRRF